MAESYKIDTDNMKSEDYGALDFFNKAIQMFEGGFEEVEINYERKNGESGTLIMSIKEKE